MSSVNEDHVGTPAVAETPILTDATQNAAASVKDMQTPSSPNGSATPDAEQLDEEATLKNLTATVRDQDDLERDISHQANLALIEAEDKKDEKRIEKAKAGKLRLENQKKTQEQKLHGARGNPTLRLRIQQEMVRIESEIELADKDIADFKKYIEQRHQTGTDDEVTEGDGNKKLPNETQREYLIRTGKITPFAKIGGPRPDDAQGELANAIIDAEDEAVAEQLEDQQAADQPRSHQNLRLPGFAEEPDVAPDTLRSAEFGLRPRKKRKVQREVASSDEFDPSATSEAASPGSFIADDADDADDYDMTDLTRTTPRKTPKAAKETDQKVDFSRIDDGNEEQYQARLSDWVERRGRARQRKQEQDGLPVHAPELDGEEEWFKPSPDQPDHVFENGLKLPGDIYPSLFDYQKTGVQWLAELYDQKVGGIVGDEMGLGKTVQLISFVAALHYSKKLTKPVIVVAPATVLRQWVAEFHRWWPALRVSILHSSGSGMLNVRSESRIEDEEFSWDAREKKPKTSNKAAKKIVDRVVKHGHVLITTYAGLQTYEDVLIPVDWAYAVLDEGHKIRNPNTAITVFAKELRTPNRVILSGTPMQNNLTELWSLFDFIYPMRLGTLVNFRNQFEIPIKHGQYANASNLDIMTGQQCAETLKDTISPYLLQRVKKDVAADLPKKTEQVLFCKLTKYQRQNYENFLKSGEMREILSKSRQSLYGIDILRKICNHPDLLDPTLKNRPGYKWGKAAKSGKMQVVRSLLPMWKRMGHKTLLFCQGTQMLDILEGFVKRQGDINYLRMDGKTAIKDRQSMVDQFNKNPDIHLFLMTTKVGGLGTNLTGANRVIIFDPDWNPSTDIQARERAWRLGQKREVTIYRLMTAGTIEEKIYQRQIFKQFLTNKVLKDPKQRGGLNLSDLNDLFTLGADEDGGPTETSQLFRGSEVAGGIRPKPKITPGNGGGNHNLEDQHALMLQNSADQGGDDDVVQEIAGVAKVEDFQEGEEAPADEEDRIMAGLFARGGVHEALEHDEIVNGRKKVRADQGMLLREAKRIAAEAASHLRRAGEQARHVPIGTVTWTGEVGEGGRPSNVRRGRGGPSSSNVLAGVADRQGLSNGTGSPGSSRAGTPGARANGSVSVKEFEKMIPRYIQRHGGQCPSKLLVDHFNQYCVGKSSVANFKNALSKVAEMKQHGSSLRTVWTLRAAYK